ncbi:unnamed protein product [Arctogadus glacialis]
MVLQALNTALAIKNDRKDRGGVSSGEEERRRVGARRRGARGATLRVRGNRPMLQARERGPDKAGGPKNGGGGLWLSGLPLAQS